MKLGQYNNWVEETNRYSGTPKDTHVVADNLPADYTDISSLENWDKYGEKLLNSNPVYGFKDWKCLQREMKTLAIAKVSNDFNANWDNLNANEKMIVCKYLLSLVPPAKFAATVTDANERIKISIDFDLNNRRARGNWQTGTGRAQILRSYLFGKIGKANALLALVDAVKDGLLELYEGGIEGTVEDGVIGINDFILARTGTVYETTGLAARGYAIVDGSGDTLQDVANAMISISHDGMY